MLRKFLPSVGMLILVGLLSFGVLAMQKPNPLTSPSAPRDVDGLQQPDAETMPDVDEEPEQVACTADAKLCPDGTAVGRVGPNCEFAPCPGVADAPEDDAVVYCDRSLREVCQLNEEPVCGTHENERAETFMNACFACADETVVSYVAGECNGF